MIKLLDVLFVSPAGERHASEKISISTTTRLTVVARDKRHRPSTQLPNIALR